MYTYLRVSPSDYNGAYFHINKYRIARTFSLLGEHGFGLPRYPIHVVTLRKTEAASVYSNASEWMASIAISKWTELVLQMVQNWEGRSVTEKKKIHS